MPSTTKCKKCDTEGFAGKFCKLCGERLAFLCECGVEVTGKFCASCGIANHSATFGTSMETMSLGSKASTSFSLSASDASKVQQQMAWKEKTPSTLQSLKALEYVAWRKGTQLGKGSFGCVYLGMLAGGKLSAVKAIELGSFESPDAKELKQLQDEVNVMSELRHENIVQYYGSSFDNEKNTLHLFMEYVAGGSIQSLWKAFDGFPDSAVQSFTRQILLGLNFLHENGIAHRDLKGDNLLVSNDGTVKLADFGSSKKLDGLCSKTHGCKTMVGTPYWMAPEVITDDSGYGLKADIWSVGCTVVEMVSGKPPWPEFTSMWAAIYHIANCKEKPPNIPKDLDPKLADFIDKTLQREIEMRPSCADLLKHEYCDF